MTCRDVKHTILYLFQTHLDTFLHSRTGVAGCRLSGWIRFLYAMIFLYSRTLLAMELPFLFDPQTGVMPYRAMQSQREDGTDWTIFAWYPDSRLVLYGMYYVGLLNGWLLLLGIYPRLQLVGIFLFLINLHNHSNILWDNQEAMLRLWSFFLIFMPLDHITWYDGFGGWVTTLRTMVKNHLGGTTTTSPTSSTTRTTTDSSSNEQLQQSQSWPLWPFPFVASVHMLHLYGCRIGEIRFRRLAERYGLVLDILRRRVWTVLSFHHQWLAI